MIAIVDAVRFPETQDKDRFFLNYIHFRINYQNRLPRLPKLKENKNSCFRMQNQTVVHAHLRIGKIHENCSHQRFGNSLYNSKFQRVFIFL